MKLSTKYILFVALLHLVTLGLTWLIFSTNKLYFIAAEILIIISLAISARLYAQLIKPLRYMMQGVEAIKDRDFNVKFLPTGQYEIDQLVDVYNRMIEELRMERTKQEQQHFFLNKLIHTSPTGIVILDHDDRIALANPKALQILSTDASQLIGMPVSELSHPLFQQAAILKTGESILLKSNGVETYKLSKSHFIDRGFARQFVMIEELTAEILEAEKNVYGKVIRMMAHEVNNTIGPVNSILQSTLTTDTLWQHQQYDVLKDALQVAMERNYNLNQFMRNFAELVKLPAPQKRTVDIGELLLSVTGLLSIKASEKNIIFRFENPSPGLQIAADVQLMEQVLINIVKNSMEAITQEGSITFTIKPQEKILEIIDTGQGITTGDSNQVFSPFFSTKKDGQGIGLTLVREVLLAHGFEFSLQTVRPGYTVFSIHFRN
jgi:two-component system nitrogen regulation sensor histidine kinase NtrY